MVDWEEMKLKKKDKYLPVDYRDSLYNQLMEWQQGNKSVVQYTEKFDKLMRCEVMENEPKTLARLKVD